MELYYTSQCASQSDLNSPSRKSKCSIISELVTKFVSKSISTESLTVIDENTQNYLGKKLSFRIHWKIKVEIFILEEDGSLLDCALLSAMVALKDSLFYFYLSFYFYI